MKDEITAACAGSLCPASSMLDDARRVVVPDRRHFLEAQREVIEWLARAGMN
jgi:hypothetical protein